MRVRNRGFTLIELLSIIVILAVISVITVPIVMNIVDESRKGTAKISALGYKDAIMKYYISGITDGTLTNNDLNGSYNVLNGVLFNTLENSTEHHLIPVTGEVPERGNIDITKGDLVSGCIEIGKYAVVFTGGNVSRVDKNDCIHASNITARQLLYTPPEEVELDVEITNVQEAIDYLVNNMSGGGASYIFDSQGGSAQENRQTDRYALSDLPKSTKEGYYFVGWYDAQTGGNKITTETLIDTDKTVYAHWYQIPSGTTRNGVYYYTTPVTVYYNPANPSDVCDSTNSVTELGTKTGCMKWYAYSEKNGIINMILAHDLNRRVSWINSSNYGNSETLGPQLGVSGMCSTSWNSNYGSNCKGPLTALKYLNDNTLDWVTTVQGDFATYTASSSVATYSINYSVDYDNDGVKDYKARLITAQEVADIKGESWTESSSTSTVSDLPEWLLETVSSSEGFWTVSPSGTNSTNAWAVTKSNSGSSYYYRMNSWVFRYTSGGMPYDRQYGIRPVLTVDPGEIFS